MSIQDFIKKSILESGAFDGASLTTIVLGIITALAMGAVIYEVYCKDNDTFFLDKIRDIDGVSDATLIQYNGEYHG